MSTFLNRIIEGVHDMCYIWAKEMKSVFQDEGVLLFFIVVPLVYPLLYSWIYNNEVVREVPVVVVDMSNSQQSRQFIRLYDASPDVHVAYRCNDMEDARDLVEKQVAHGILYFPPDFETRLMRMEQSHVSVYCDMSLMLTYKAIFSTATAVSQQINAQFQRQLSGNYTDREDQILVQPLAVDEVQIFNTTGGYGNFILPPSSCSSSSRLFSSASASPPVPPARTTAIRTLSLSPAITTASSALSAASHFAIS